jgi:hypothetical protein
MAYGSLRQARSLAQPALQSAVIVDRDHHVVDVTLNNQSTSSSIAIKLDRLWVTWLGRGLHFSELAVWSRHVLITADAVTSHYYICVTSCNPFPQDYIANSLTRLAWPATLFIYNLYLLCL